MFGTDHPAGSGTLEEIYRTMDKAGLGEVTRARSRRTSSDPSR
jgi:hypothetical protein